MKNSLFVASLKHTPLSPLDRGGTRIPLLDREGKDIPTLDSGTKILPLDRGGTRTLPLNRGRKEIHPLFKEWVRGSSYLFFVLSILLFASCVKEPTSPSSLNLQPIPKNGAFILCEGIWGMNNSSLARFDLKSQTVIPDFFSSANPGFQLGDIANDIVLKGDTAYVAVTTAQAIISFNVVTGKFIDTLIFHGKHAPRKICVVDDSNAYVTDLYGNSILHFNPVTMKFLDEIPVGPAPEGIANDGIYIFAANSGYGDYLANQPKAGTISVIDILSGKEIKAIDAGPNDIELKIDKIHNRLFASYNNLPSHTNEVGGIIEYDLNTLNKIHQWSTVASRITLSVTGDTLFFLNKTGVAMLDFTEQNPEIRQFITNPQPNDFWYALGVCSYDNTIWVGNARNYQIDGEVQIYSLLNPSTIINHFQVGVNPNTIIFF